MASLFNAEQEAYLNNHKWAVLATGRSDGSPQISQVFYVWDGTNIIISIKSYTAKWKNALRQPKVALLVHDDRKQLIVYGIAECIEQDPLRTELMLLVMRAIISNPSLEADDDFINKLNQDQRTVGVFRGSMQKPPD